MTEIPTAEACLALARAILLRAFRDLQDPAQAAEVAQWLRGDQAAAYMAAVGLDPELVGAAIERVKRGPSLRWIKQWQA